MFSLAEIQLGVGMIGENITIISVFSFLVNKFMPLLSCVLSSFGFSFSFHFAAPMQLVPNLTLVNVDSNTANISWKCPHSLSGLLSFIQPDITHFVLHYEHSRFVSNKQMSIDASVCSSSEYAHILVDKLFSNHLYYFRLALKNIVGISSTFSHPLQVKTSLNVPTWINPNDGTVIQPRLITATSSLLVINWNVPQLNCDHPCSIHNYTLAMRQGNGNWVELQNMIGGSANTEIVMGVSEGDPYYFRVKAVNDIGWSDWSAISDPIGINARPPDPPIAVTASNVQPRSIQFSVIAPTSTNGAPILRYLLYVERANTGERIVNTELSFDSPALLVKNLVPGVLYRAWSRAINSAGMSEASGVAFFSTPATTPNKPDPPSATCTSCIQSRSIRVSWAEPESNGAPIINYDIQINSGSNMANTGWQTVFSGSSLMTDITDLSPGTTYRFQVIAYNSEGASLASNSLFVTTLIEPPTMTSGPQLHTAGSLSPVTLMSIHISWSGAIPNGAVVNRYDVQMRLLGDLSETIQDESSIPWSTIHIIQVATDSNQIRQWKAENLPPGHRVQFRIIAYNEKGPSDPK